MGMDEVNEDMQRVSDLCPGQIEVDEFTDIAAVLDKEIILTGYGERNGEHGAYYTVQGRYPDSKETIGFNTGGTVLMKKLKIVGDLKKFPCKAKIFRPEGKKYFDMA